MKEREKENEVKRKQKYIERERERRIMSWKEDWEMGFLALYRVTMSKKLNANLRYQCIKSWVKYKFLMEKKR